MSFVKRSDATPVCHSKPLDSVKNWNDHFFWVDSTTFPLSVSLKSKILSKDPPPKLSQYDTEACHFLRTHTAPFRKFLEPFLLFAEMDLFSFIRHSDPPKVRIREGDLAEREVKLLKMTEGRTVSLGPPVTVASGDSGDSIDKLFDEGNDADQEHSVERGDDILEETIAKDASEVAAEKPKKKRKRNVTGDASGSTYPPKKLRDDYHSLPPNTDTSGKSLAALRSMVPEGSGIPRGATEPLLAASVDPMPDVGPVDSMSGLNLWTRPPHVRYVVSSYDSRHSGSYSEATSFVRSLVADAPVVTVAVTTTVVADVVAVPRSKTRDESKNLENIGDSAFAGGANADAANISKWKVKNDSILEDPYVCRDLTDRLAPPALFGQLRAMNYDQLYSEFNVRVARQVCLGAEVRMHAEHTLEKKGDLEDICVEQTMLLSERDAEIAHLKSLLSFKDTEAAEAICLRGQLTTERERDVMSEKIATLESTNVAKETELAFLSSQVAKLTSDLSGFQLSRDELISKVASLESERDCLLTQKSSLESVLDVDVIEGKAASKEIWKRMGFVIWAKRSPQSAFELFRERVEALQDEQAKALGDRSSEYLQALGQAIGYAVNKGIQDGLKAGVDHGKARRDLYVLESKKDSSIVDLMDSLRLEGVLVEIPRANDLQPSLEQLMLPIHRPEDNVVFAETSLSSSLEVVYLRVQRFKGEVKEKRLSLTNVMPPLVEPLSSKSLTGEASTSAAPITTLSTTYASSAVVLPSSIFSDQVLDAKPHNEDPPAVTFEKEELGTSPE
ncbi:hypothetical protein Tco_0913091 [Tanacetum coccineum]